MVAQSCRVVACGAHQLDDGLAVVHGTVGGTLDMVTGIHQQHVSAGFFQLVLHLCHMRVSQTIALCVVHISVHVIGVEDGDLIGALADHIRTVADTDAGEGTLGSVEGIIVGSKAGCGDLAAHIDVLHVLGGGDVAIDEHTGNITLRVLDHNGLDQSVLLLEVHYGALQRYQAALYGAVIDLRGSDGLGLHGIAGADDFDRGDLKFTKCSFILILHMCLSLSPRT